MSNRPDSLIPKVPLDSEEQETTINNSILGWKIGKLVQPEQRLQFFKQLWRNNLLHSIDSASDQYRDKVVLKNFTESLQFPFEDGGSYGLESLIGNEYITFAYTGGYLFENKDGQIEMYLAKNQNIKATPFGDFHDLASGQFKEEVGVSLSEMKKAQRCLFFHTFNTANDKIEYFVIPVETLHHEQTQMRLGEVPAPDYLEKYTDQQIINFTKKFSFASYGLTRLIISDSSRKHSISAAIASDQILPKIINRIGLRLDYGMDHEQTLREAMRERILSRAGVQNSFSRYWSSENDTEYE